MWGDVYLLIAAVLCLVIVLWKFPDDVRDIKITCGCALLIFIAGEFTYLIESPYISLIKTLILITSLSLVFVLLLMVIRRLKPIVFQYPYPVVFLPLLLPFSYTFMMDTLIVEQIILSSVQSVIIVVMFLISAGYSDYFHRKKLLYTGLTFLIVSFVLYWMLRDFLIIGDWLWKLFTSVGMVFVIYSLRGLLINKISLADYEELT